jgi:hypothetical protein
MIRQCATLLLASLALLIGQAASATPTYVVEGTIPGLGSAHVVSYQVLGNNGSAYAVAFDSQQGGVKGVSFCGDLLHTIGLNESYAGAPIDLASLPGGYTTAAKIAQRWSYDLGSLASSKADAAAGVQVAIWETIYGAGFTLTSSLNAGTQAAYDAVLGVDYASLGVGNTVFLDVSKNGTAKQDHFFTPNGPSTPEPAAAFLFSAGLVVMGHSFRRRTAVA